MVRFTSADVFPVFKITSSRNTSLEHNYAERVAFELRKPLGLPRLVSNGNSMIETKTNLEAIFAGKDLYFHHNYKHSFLFKS